MKYVNDATSIVFLILGVTLVAVMVKVFLLNGKRGRP